jgi:hypothetical protein
MSASTPVTARRILATVLAAGALVGSAAASASADQDRRPHRPQVEISGVQYDSPGHDDRSSRSLNKEWVDIHNTSRRTVNLDGWTLSEDKDGNTYTFRHYRLEGHATVRVHTGFGRNSHSDLFQGRRNYVWDNRSDTATLANDRGRLVDSQSWGGHHGGHHGHHNR